MVEPTTCYFELEQMTLLELLGLSRPAETEAHSSEADALRRIVSALDEIEPEKARYIACFAYLLGRVANADLDISEDETREMERIVESRGGLPEAQAVLVVQIAKSQNKAFGSTQSFTVTQEFNQLATRPQKLAMLDCLFAVSSSDQSISTVEDNEIRNIARELRLDHSDFIASRSTYRQYIETLKRPAPSA